jgi:putative ABC transport system ATP-binding protein
MVKKMKSVPVVELKEVSKIYGQYETKVKAIDRISCKIYPSEFVAVVGPSGCGKSTLLNLMGLLDRPTQGRVLIDGLDTSTITGKEVASFRGRKMGFVFQSYNIIPRFTALQNVMLPGIIQNIPKNKLTERTLELLEEVGIAHRANHKGVHMSGGEQQKVAIARALINNPSVILADEPTGALDTKNSDYIMQILKRMNEMHKVTTIFVTHDPLQAKYGRRIIELKDGKILNDKANGEAS